MYKRERPPRETATTFPQRRKTPSFSSSLLDSIYRSIDESDPKDQNFEHCTDAPGRISIKKQSICRSSQPTTSLRRAILVDDWMEKQSTTLHCNLNSASVSSSSDSSSGATFSSSSSEAESCRFSKSRPKQAGFGKSFDFDSSKKIEPDIGGSSGGFTKTKLRALKIYGELKSLKQPISPGGRISSFLNSIFNSGNVKKAKMCYVGAVEDVSFERKAKSASASASACSSASSLSRRSKTETLTTTAASSSSSSFQSRNKMKRSVRFYPVSVIVGEDSRPCGHKPVYREDPTLIPLPARRVKDVIITKSSSASTRDRCHRARFQDYEEEDEEEDAESCDSSDLFELDHLMGIGRYREELPVYETTCLKKNQAIASGMML